MTGNNRKLIISVAIVALVALNVWRWWPSTRTSAVEMAQSEGVINFADFEVKAIPVDSLPPMSRDIFYPKKTVVVKKLVTTPVAAVPTVSVMSPEESAKESAQAEFSQIQCVGISVRNERIHAYLISSGEPSLVSSGDKVGSRFVVEKIMPDGVSLIDPDTGVGGVITVSGKK